MLLEKLHFVLQFSIGVFAFCPKLTFGEILVGKLHNLEKKIVSVANLLSKSFSILISELASCKFCILT